MGKPDRNITTSPGISHTLIAMPVLSCCLFICTAELVIWGRRRIKICLHGRTLVPVGLYKQSWLCAKVGMSCRFSSSFILFVQSLSGLQSKKQKTKKQLVHHSNQTCNHFTINQAKHFPGAFNFSPVWIPLLYQHCSTELQKPPNCAGLVLLFHILCHRGCSLSLHISWMRFMIS